MVELEPQQCCDLDELKSQMKPLFKMGDRVRLTQKGLDGLSRHARNRSGVRIERCGTVCRSTKREEAYVLWDGRRNTAVVPYSILEKAAPSQERVPNLAGQAPSIDAIDAAENSLPLALT